MATEFWWIAVLMMVGAILLAGPVPAIIKQSISAKLIPQSEIDATAQEFIREHGAGADEFARHELRIAMRCSDRHEIVRWRRIRKAIAQNVRLSRLEGGSDA